MGKKTQEAILTLGQVADRLRFQFWKVDRVFSRGLVAPAVRVHRLRCVPESRLPEIEAALLKAGYKRIGEE